MPSATFTNLNDEKKAKIDQALLTEFSTYSFPDAQVARIVKSAGIARGAFYKYFADLNDAYCYLYQKAIVEIHRKIASSQQMLTAEEYRQQIRDFLAAVNDCHYRDLIRLHFQVNENVVNMSNSRGPQPKDGREWGVMILSHETIKECLAAPEKAPQLIERCFQALQGLTKEERL